jgi:ribosomal protein S27E
MDPTASIRKHGFRKWYERQLIESHLALVTCLLCGLTLTVLVEEITLIKLDMRSLSLIGVAAAAIAIAGLSFRHYITVLERAELYGQRSTCADCKTYGRFEIIATGLDEVPGPAATAVAPLQAAWMRVKCRKCGAIWRMPE